jgi:hypothetical protein
MALTIQRCAVPVGYNWRSRVLTRNFNCGLFVIRSVLLIFLLVAAPFPFQSSGRSPWFSRSVCQRQMRKLGNRSAFLPVIMSRLSGMATLTPAASMLFIRRSAMDTTASWENLGGALAGRAAHPFGYRTRTRAPAAGNPGQDWFPNSLVRQFAQKVCISAHLGPGARVHGSCHSRVPSYTGCQRLKPTSKL